MAEVRLSVEKQSSSNHLHALNMLEVYLQGLVMTNEFLGLQTFHLARGPDNLQRQLTRLTVRQR